MKKPQPFLFFSLFSLFFLIFSPNRIRADWTNPSGNQPAQIADLETVFAKVTGIALPLLGLSFVVALIIGGSQYLTAGDNPKNAEKASQTLTFAFLGLLIAVGAWIIIQLISTITGADLSKFIIYQS